MSSLMISGTVTVKLDAVDIESHCPSMHIYDICKHAASVVSKKYPAAYFWQQKAVQNEAGDFIVIFNLDNLCESIDVE